MNWFTSRSFANSSLEAKETFVSKHECCDHVYGNAALLYKDQMECDSFGSEHYGVCKACAEAAEEELDNELLTCDDCKKEYPRKEVTEWRWYDFYAAQGDEPVIVCAACRAAEKHQERIRRDKADYLHEFPE